MGVLILDEKTNVMRLLEKKKIKYTLYNLYEKGMTLDTIKTKTSYDIAQIIGINPNQMFKTLVTVAKSNNHYVFVLPANTELDLKKCAKAVKEKSISMVKSKELLELTGYIHGGCSPIGMKKFFTTTINNSAKDFDSIVFSAGKIGLLVQVSLQDLQKIIRVSFADITVEEQKG